MERQQQELTYRPFFHGIEQLKVFGIIDALYTKHF